MKFNRKPIQCRPDIHDALFTQTSKLSSIEGKRVSMDETIRRMMNVPQINSILENDAKYKRLTKK
jgi:hypothetical protein